MRACNRCISHDLWTGSFARQLGRAWRARMAHCTLVRLLLTVVMAPGGVTGKEQAPTPATKGSGVKLEKGRMRSVSGST